MGIGGKRMHVVLKDELLEKMECFRYLGSIITVYGIEAGSMM